MESAFLIVNPSASKGRQKSKKRDLVEAFKKRGYSVVVGYTSDSGHGELLAENAVLNGFKVIVAAGGDGTVNEVINGIMRAPSREGVKLGIIPIGRGNDFAWAAGIPKDTTKAVSAIVRGNTTKVDVGFIKGTDNEEGRYFLNGAGFGFEPMVNFKAMEYKHLNGMPSYVAAFFYILRHPPEGYRLKMDIDGKVFDINTQQVSISNGKRMGSAFIMAPKAEVDDGVFDVMFTNKAVKGVGLIRLAVDFLNGAQVKDKKNFTYLNAKRVKIVSDKSDVQAHIDGEVFTKRGSEFDVEILPGAIELIR